MADHSFEETLWAFRHALPEQARIYVAGCSGEPIALARFIEENPAWAAGVTFFGVWIPGVNSIDWASLHKNARSESIFVTPATQGSFRNGRHTLRPLSYTQSVNWLRNTEVDGAIVMVSPETTSGQHSLGVSADFSGLLLKREGVPVVGLINPAMPAPRYGVSVASERLTFCTVSHETLITVPPGQLSKTFQSIGRKISTLIDDGDALQFGLGTVQQAVLESLSGHRNLRVHSGMVSDPIVRLLASGAIANQRRAVTTGVAIGSSTLYGTACTDDRFFFAPVQYTHAIKTLATTPQFKAINSCISVDLFGQANAEFIGTRQISGTGGLCDFLRGASASDGGRGIIALASTAKNGSISRIVPRLDPNAVSVARGDVATVVTEHGIADLRHCSIEERAERLISIADPAFRTDLASAWEGMRRLMG